VITALKQRAITLTINGNEGLSYQDAQSQIANNQWDIVFATSPVVSIFSADSGYTFVAVMFPDSDVYQSGLFVHVDSEIQSVDDITSQHTLALGEFGKSASSFFMPIYDLYGKSVSVNTGNRGSKIVEMVKTRKADIDAAAISNFGDASRSNDPELRYIHQSRNIPSSAVYLSPELALEDREVLKHILMDAPDEVKEFENSNYGEGEEPNYDYFRGIIKTVDQVLICSDFSSNPVNLFCPEGFEPYVVRGEMNGWSARGNNLTLVVSTSDGEIYNVVIDRLTLEEAIAPKKINDLQGWLVETRTPNSPVSDSSQVPTIPITQMTQIKFLDSSLANNVLAF